MLRSFPTIIREDICYWMNHELNLQNISDRYCLNAAVEESSLGERFESGILLQDQFIQSKISKNDILIVSIGGNDIALKPTLSSIINTVLLLYIPFPEFFYYFGLSFFVDLFKTKIEAYIEELIKNEKPKKILVCNLYYFDLNGKAWPGAEEVLKFAGYYENGNPDRLKRVIRLIFKRAISQIKIEGVGVVPVPLYEVLDGSNSDDYKYRVEPSSQGGHKMTKFLLEHI